MTNLFEGMLVAKTGKVQGKSSHCICSMDIEVHLYTSECDETFTNKLLLSLTSASHRTQLNPKSISKRVETSMKKDKPGTVGFG